MVKLNRFLGFALNQCFALQNDIEVASILFLNFFSLVKILLRVLLNKKYRTS